jgi:hypothetical protein
MECSQASSHSAFRLHALCIPRTGLEFDHTSWLNYSRPELPLYVPVIMPRFSITCIAQLYASRLEYTDEPAKENLQQGWLFYHRGDGGRGQRLAHDLRPREARHEPCGLQIAFFDPENRAFVRLWKPNSKGIRSNHRGPVCRLL